MAPLSNTLEINITKWCISYVSPRPDGDSTQPADIDDGLTRSLELWRRMTPTRLMGKSLFELFGTEVKHLQGFQVYSVCVANVHKCHWLLYWDFIADHLEDEEGEEGGASRWDDRSTIRPTSVNCKYLPFYWRDIAVFKISIIGSSFHFRSVITKQLKCKNDFSKTHESSGAVMKHLCSPVFHFDKKKTK